MFREVLELLELFIICLIMLGLVFIWIICMTGLVLYAFINILGRRSLLVVKSRRV